MVQTFSLPVTPRRIQRGLSQKAGQLYLIHSAEGTHTLRAPSFILASVTVFVLSGGQAAVVSRDGKACSAFSYRWPQFQVETLKIDSLPPYLEQHALEIALVLDSIQVGSEEERIQAEMQAAQLEEKALHRWQQDWNFRHGVTEYSLKRKAERLAGTFLQKYRRSAREPISAN